ncbi:unnamed protein product [Polarella glacialis]|uniref:Glycosyltransferase 61 catalytic domain-containing protein n=1 Tax=Polarella glacialis TaxID=89957 RepID=A0A813GD13_POLGL|nr:unnamed protein product [Polarella glacialis]CAE8667552.1 unnamed protein product [Polarella glacialis]
MPAVWRRRDSLQVYLRFPRNGQWETLGLGRRVAPEGGATRNPILLHWLQLLSPRPPLLLPDPEQPRLARNSTLPGSLQLAEIGPGGRCHPAGIWGSPNGMSKSELDLFVEVGRSFPQWGGRSQQELLHLIWGRRTDAVQDTPTQTDHCLNLTSAACIRVLVVRRGTSASASRSVVNIEDALSWISTAFSEKQVRVATVEMEQFSIGEEIALAGLVDFWISVYGSAMWWPIYMPPGACVMWLLPKVRWFYTAAHIPIDLANVHWTNFSLLEYGDLRPLLHVVVPGVLPPPGVPGHFELDEKLEKAHALAFQELDIFVNLDLFSSAFSDAVQYLVVQKSEYV